jgi:predicted nucleic acid-binding protein
LSVYVESSALLTWLFGEQNDARVGTVIESADFIVTSDLTLIECDRAIHRQTALGHLTPDEARQMIADLSAETSSWIVLELTSQIVQRARQPFPNEPIRSLDALHVAWALRAQSQHGSGGLLSLDERVRRVGKSVGLDILPA